MQRICWFGTLIYDATWHVGDHWIRFEVDGEDGILHFVVGRLNTEKPGALDWLQCTFGCCFLFLFLIQRCTGPRANPHSQQGHEHKLFQLTVKKRRSINKITRLKGREVTSWIRKNFKKNQRCTTFLQLLRTKQWS